MFYKTFSCPHPLVPPHVATEIVTFVTGIQNELTARTISQLVALKMNPKGPVMIRVLGEQKYEVVMDGDQTSVVKELFPEIENLGSVEKYQ